MNNRQRAKNDSYDRIADFNTRNAVVLAAIDGYAIEQTAFNTAHAAVETAGGKQQVTTGKNRELADDDKQDMAKLLAKLAMKASVKAGQAGNVTLEQQLDVTESYFFKATKIVALQRALVVRNLLNDNLATLTNIKPADITAADSAIATYDAAKDEPIENVQLKKAQGTDQLPAAYTTADKAINNMFKLVKSELTDTHPEIVAELELAKEIIDTGIRHTEVDFTIVSFTDGSPIGGATVTDESNGKQYTTDKNGEATIDSHLSGDFTFTIAATGYQTVHVGTHINRGKLNTVDVKLKGV